jgi:hypothetical protein
MTLIEGKTYKLSGKNVKVIKIENQDVEIEYNGKIFPNCQMSELIKLLEK